MSDDPTVFEAEITPNRSLSRRGLRIVVGFTCLVSLATTTLFWSLGAWPVAGFSGAEVLLALVLLRAHAASRRERERLLLSAGAIRVVRTDSRGVAREVSLSPAWVAVTLQERPGRVPGLYLQTRGRRLEVGAVLGEDEKRDLAAALSKALDTLRNPVFDNPQLR